MIVAFDLEGTLVDAELFPALGLDEEKRALLEYITNRAMNGSQSFESSLSQRLYLIKGTSLETAQRVARTLPMTKGAEETVSTVKRLGGTPCIITGGFGVLAYRVAYELGIKYVSCNHFKTENGKITGIHEPVVTGEIKAEKLQGLASWLGVDPRNCVAIGDGANDIQMMNTVGLSISFNGRKKVREAAKVNVEGSDLRAILPYLDVFGSFSSE